MPPISADARSIFGRAAEIASSAERAAFLDAACAASVPLRAEVESLLAALDRAGDFMVRPAAEASDATVYKEVIEGPGTTIGPYKLLQKIGEGGFGVVYMAEQERPVRRMVALKIIKPGMDTSQVIARFESERQALALMDHPNIAKVFDAGATGVRNQESGVRGQQTADLTPDSSLLTPDAGRPFFVMELVKGVPLTEFCDKNHMPAKQRLELFIDVCHAIQHAHQKGIIHRDIKPSNVMVTLHDGVPVVKVIDFGVAKATVQKLTERTLFTAYGAMIGTPAYMSPEQAEMSGLDIDTRSDIYSLGVLLYELLTGTTPLDVERLREAGYAEMQRLIREEEAPRPSTRLSSLGDSATVLAGNRGTDPKHLARLLAGELDWIVLKALEKDRSRRYETANSFALDVQHYLADEPVEACPPSAGYRLRKFARRNQRTMATAALVGVTLVIGTIVSLVFAFQAHHAANEAFAAGEDKMKEAAKAIEEAEKATLARQEAERVLGLQLVTNGIAAMDKGDVTGAAIFFAEAARRDRSNPERTEQHRLRVASAVRLSARPEHILFHDGDIRFAALSPDGTHLVTAGTNAQVWDAQTGAKVGPSLPHDAPIGHAVFSKDSRRLLTTTHRYRPGKPTSEQFVRVWDVASGRLLTPPLVHEGWGNAAFMLDDEFVLTRNAPTTLQLWHAETGKPAGAPLEHPATSYLHLHCSPDGQYAAIVTAPPDDSRPQGEVKKYFAPPQLWLWNLRTRQATTVPLTARDVHLGPEFSPDGTRLVYNDPDDVANVLDVRTGKRLAAYHRPGGGELWHTFAAAAGRVFTWTNNLNVPAEVWDLATGRAAGAPVEYHNEFDSGRDWGRIGAFAMLSPDGRRVLAPLPDEPACRVVWDTSTGKRVGQALKHETMITWELFSPDGRIVVTGSDDGMVRAWQAERKAHSLARSFAFSPFGPPMMHQRDVSQMFFSVDGRRVFTIAGSVVRIWPLHAAPQPDARLEHPHAIARVLRSADGQRAVTITRPTNQSAEVRIWDLTTGKLVGEPRRNTDDESFLIFGTTISPDNRHVLLNIGRSALPKRAVRSFEIGDLVTGRWQSLALKTEELLNEQFSATGRYVLFTRTIGISGTPVRRVAARLLETTTAQDVSDRLEKSDNLIVLGWSPDDRLVLTQVKNDKSMGVRVWDLDRRQALTTVFHDGVGELKARFSEDGRCVYTEVRADEGAEVRIWDAQTGTPLGPFVQVFPKREAVKLEIMAAELSPDGRRLLVAGMAFPTRALPVRLWDLTAGTAVDVPDAIDSASIGWHGELPRSFSPDGRRLLAKTANGLRLFDGHSGVPLTPEMTPSAAFRHRDRFGRGFETTGRFSQDGGRVLTENPAQIWDAVTAQPLTPPMPTGVTNLERAIAFSAAGDPVVVHEHPNVLAVYRVSSTGKPLKDLAAMAETLAGRRLTTSGNLQTLEVDRLASGWKALRAAEPAPPDGPAETLAWHRRQVERLGYGNVANFTKGPGLGSLKILSAWIWSNSPIDLIERTDAFAAAWHLDRILAHERSPSAVAARGYARFVVGEWDKSAADFTEAMAGGVPDLSGAHGEAQAERGRFAEARDDFLKTLAELPGGQVTPSNDPRGLLMKLAYVQSALKDKAGLHETLAKVRVHMAKLKPGAPEAAVLLWTLALDPARDPEFLGIVKAFEEKLLPRGGYQSFERASSLTAVGLARFRLGNYESALAALTEAEPFGVPDQRLVSWLLLAMTCQKLDRTKEARSWFDKASTAEQPAPQHWIVRLVRQDLRRQAEELLK